MQKNIDGYFSPESLYLETSSDYNKIHRSKYFIECIFIIQKWVSGEFFNIVIYYD